MSEVADACERIITVQPLLEDAPCDDCRLARRCADGRLACEAFHMFVMGAGAPRWRQAPRAPSRALYLAALAER